VSAYYNPQTKQIVGCKRGSLTWFHEWRHHLQDRAGVLKVYSVCNVLFDCVAFFCLLFGYYFFALVFVAGNIMFLNLLELDAWVYAVRRKWF